MASTDAKPFPIKNTAYRVTFPILDADGDLVAGAAGLDSEISKDGGTFTDCTNEATQIATSSGLYYLDLTATEMNADTVAIIVKTSTSGAKTTPIVLYPVEDTDIPVNVKAIAGTVQSATDLKDFVDTGYDPSAHRTQAQIKGTDDIDLSATQKTSVNAEADMALSDIKLDHLVAVADSDDPVNDSIIAKMAASDGDWSEFDKATDALEALRDRGDAAWITGGGGGITDIVQVVPSIPTNIDLANTKMVRLALYLINSLDDLPTTVEITPGTITIERSADGGTSWSVIVNAAACTEQAGQIYYDEVFDSGAGYASGDMIRVTFKSQKITVAANDYEITDATYGWMFHTRIDGGAAGDSASVVADAVWDEATADHVAAGSCGLVIDRVLEATEIKQASVNDASASTTEFVTNLSEADDNFWNRNSLIFTSGNDKGQMRKIHTYNGTTKKITLYTALAHAPANSDTFVIVAARNFRMNLDDITKIVDDVWDEALTAAAHDVANSAGKRLRQLGGRCLHDGTAQAGASYTITLAAAASVTDHIYNCNLLIITDGTGVGQTRTVAAYNGTTKVVTVNRDWWIQPDATSKYCIFANDVPLVVDHGVAQAGTSTSITLRSTASSINSTYVGIVIAIIAGVGKGQARVITAYNGITKVATITPAWITNPTSSSVYAIMPNGCTCVANIEDAALVPLADAIWDELQSGHTNAGSFGLYLDAKISDTDVIGSGALSCTWTQKDDGGNPMDNVQVWITTDEAGANVVAGSLLTNASGETTFMLDAGTYYVWREKGGYNFTNPQSWTVS